MEYTCWSLENTARCQGCLGVVYANEKSQLMDVQTA